MQTRSPPRSATTSDPGLTDLQPASWRVVHFGMQTMPRTLQAAFVCIALITLCACTTPRDRLLALAHASQAEASVIQTSLFPLQVVAPKALHVSKTLTIYIEGDGHAWATATQPSLDPSPHNLGVTSLALAPGHPGIYLARPCQFVMNDNCRPTLWTDARFGGAVVDAMQSALDILKTRYHAHSSSSGIQAAQRSPCCLRSTVAISSRCRPSPATSIPLLG